MDELFECGAVLFESGEEEEALRIECVVTNEGELRIMQESAGPLSEWCFEDSPHRVETVVEVGATAALGEYFHVDGVRQLPAVLRLEYTGYDCAARIRALLQRLDIPYGVLEDPIAR